MQRDNLAGLDANDRRPRIPAKRRRIMSERVHLVFEALDRGAIADDARRKTLHEIFALENPVLYREVVALVARRVADDDNLLIDEIFRLLDRERQGLAVPQPIDP